MKFVLFYHLWADPEFLPVTKNGFHGGLLHRLFSYGLYERIYAIIKSFLPGSSMKVVVKPMISMQVSANVLYSALFYVCFLLTRDILR